MARKRAKGKAAKTVTRKRIKPKKVRKPVSKRSSPKPEVSVTDLLRGWSPSRYSR